MAAISKSGVRTHPKKVKRTKRKKLGPKDKPVKKHER